MRARKSPSASYPGSISLAILLSWRIEATYPRAEAIGHCVMDGGKKNIVSHEAVGPGGLPIARDVV